MSVHHSSKSNEWETPQDLFDKLHKVYKFTLDPCATKKTAKCKKFFTIKEDGLKKSWGKNRVFMNPPYGTEIGKWMQKAYEASLKGATVVCLIPSRTDTKWWHGWAMKGKIEFIKGRLKFSGHKNSAPFPSAIVVFKKKGKI